MSDQTVRPPSDAPVRRLGTESAIDLKDADAFKGHPLVAPLRERYRRNARLADYALARLLADLEALDHREIEERGRGIFTAIQGRVKQEDSFFDKLRRTTRDMAVTRGFSAETLEAAFTSIGDLTGVRFSCSYLDEATPIVNQVVRPGLATAGYDTELRGELNLDDKDLLDTGDDVGYRSYHFFVRVPTVVDI